MRPSTLPESAPNEIIRESLLFGLHFQLDANPVVVVNGPSNVGKTTLLAQFYVRNKQACIATFLSGASAWGYDYDSVSDDLCLQARRILGLPPAQGPEIDTSTGKWRSAAMALDKYAANQQTPIYFVLDGLDEIPDPDESAARALYSLMPLGMRWFRFLLCGTRALKYIKSGSVKNVGEFLVTPFIKEEAIACLSDIMSSEDAGKLYGLSKGIPGYYAGVRRIIGKQGSLPDRPPVGLSSILEYEWNKVKDDSVIEHLLAFLCYDKDNSTLERAANFLGISIDALSAVVARTTLIEIRQNCLYFAHESLKGFIQSKVLHLQRKTIDKIIEGFVSDGSNECGSAHIPDLLSQAGRYDDLIAYLDDKYILNAIRNKKAARFVQEKALMGLRAASKNERTEDVIRFGLQGANLDELYLDDHWASRIQAFISLGEMSAAFDIARSFAMPEDRIQALCCIGLHQKLKDGRVDDSLSEEIAREHSLLDKDHLGSRAYEIAADLVHIHPKLALMLVQNVTALEVNGPPQARDAQRGAINNQVVESPEDCASSTLEILWSRITDPVARSASRVFNVTTRGQSGEQALAEVEKMTGDEEKAYFIRLWLTDNRVHKGREVVVRHAIRFAISSKNISPTPSFFFDIVRAIDGLDSAKELLAQIKGIAPRLQRVGPTADYYQLMLRIFEMDAIEDPVAALPVFERLFNDVGAIDDAATRACSYAEMLISIFRVRLKKEQFGNKQHTQNIINAIESAVKIVLDCTADHYQALRRCIRKVARLDCGKAYEIVQKMNTEERRDRGFSEIIYYAIAGRLKACDVASLELCFQAIVDPDIKARCLLAVLRELAFGEKKEVPIYGLNRLHFWCRALECPESKATALAFFAIAEIVIGSKTAKDKEISELTEEVIKQVALIDDTITRIGTLHTLTFIFADYDKSIARSFLDEGENSRKALFVKTGGVERCLVLNLRITLRAFSGLIKRKAYDEIELRELIDLISSLPNVSTKVYLFSELAVRFYLADDILGCRRIAADHLMGLLQGVSGENVDLKNTLLTVSAPALYGANPTACLATLETVQPRARDGAIRAILEMRITKLAPGEPHEDRSTLDEKTTSADILEILKLIEYLENDGAICHNIEIIVRYLSESRPRVTKTEKAEICSKIKNLVEGKFPSKRFTVHDGYRILGDGYVLCLGNARLPEWESLIARAKKIPNISDRSLVLASFAEMMGGKFLQKRKEILKEALESAERIPVAYDRGERSLFIAEVAKPLDREVFKDAMESIVGKSASRELDDRSLDLRRRAIDMIHSEDENLANRMVSALDDEPLRDIKKTLEKRLELLNLQQKFAKRELDGVDIKGVSDVPRIFWRNLRRLNSGFIEAPKFRNLAPLFLAIEGRRIEDIYPILCFGVESCVRNYSNTEEVFGVPQRIFRVCLSATRMIVHCLSENRDPTVRVSVSSDTPGSDPNVLIVRKGDKGKACDFVRANLANSDPQRIFVVDAYFTDSDLDLVELLRDQCSTATIYVMTCKKKIQEVCGAEGAAATFRSRWKTNYGDREPGDVKIFVVGKKGSGEPPIHDRFIVTDKVGIKLGGSWGGVGGDKQMDLTVLDSIGAQQWLKEAERYFIYMHAHHNGVPLVYDIFSL